MLICENADRVTAQCDHINRFAFTFHISCHVINIRYKCEGKYTNNQMCGEETSMSYQTIQYDHESTNSINITL
jgi:hypothetical protein